MDRRDDDIVTWLPDLTDVPLAELMTTTDPILLAATDRIVAEVLTRDPTDGGCC